MSAEPHEITAPSDRAVVGCKCRWLVWPDYLDGLPQRQFNRLCPVHNEHDTADMRNKANELLASALPTEMGQALLGMHEMYRSLREGGFTEYQALWIISCCLSGGFNPKDDNGKS